MLGRAHGTYKKLIENGYEVTVVDVWKVKPLNTEQLARTISKYDLVVTIEEQTLSGGFGSAICEAVSDEDLKKSVLRIGLPERYIFENGNREHLLNTNGLSVDEIYDKILKFHRCQK
jgi:deoxyxylulose-5-phosphate synthase